MRTSKYILKNDEITVIKTGQVIREYDDPIKFKELKRKINASYQRKLKDDLMRSCGLTKVRGAVSGKIYWE